VSLVNLDETRRSRLRNHRNAEIAEIAGAQFEAEEKSPRSKVVADYASALGLNGEIIHGAKIFERDCMGCHQVDGRGHELGPNLLTTVSGDASALVSHVFDPNRYVPPDYVQYVVIDSSGRNYTGMISAQTATSITLKREKGVTETLLRANVEELVSTGKSLMPEDFEKKISKQDMADLIAFLRDAQLRAPVKKAAAGDPNQKRDFGTLPGLVDPG
jgi:putative heme-binding domain-containing protein